MPSGGTGRFQQVSRHWSSGAVKAMCCGSSQGDVELSFHFCLHLVVEQLDLADSLSTC